MQSVSASSPGEAGIGPRVDKDVIACRHPNRWPPIDSVCRRPPRTDRELAGFGGGGGGGDGGAGEGGGV